MPEVIEQVLYITTPLYKYQKGKTEHYLKDDASLLGFGEIGLSSLK